MRKTERETTKRGDAIQHAVRNISRMSSVQYIAPDRQTLLHKFTQEYVKEGVKNPKFGRFGTILGHFKQNYLHFAISDSPLFDQQSHHELHQGNTNGTNFNEERLFCWRCIQFHYIPDHLLI